MAKIKLSAIVSEMRGKLNGSVFSKNRGGAYIRTKVTPVNPQTVAQGNVRATLTGLSQAWRNLTEAERTAWNNAVNAFGKTDIFGDIKIPSGIALHNRLNLNLAAIGVAPITAPPAPSPVGYIDSLTITAAAGTPALSAAFTGIDLDATQSIIVEATAPQSAGKSFVKSEYRQISVISATATSPANLLAAYTAKFGALVEGQKVFVRFRVVSEVTGLSGQATSASAIIAA